MDPLTMAIGGKILGGLFGIKAASQEAKARKAMAQYNARVARINAKAQADAVEAQSKRLVKQQREFAAQQRMSVFQRGGLVAGTDLQSLIDSAITMQMDLLEVQRQRDVAKLRGESVAQKTIYEGQLGANIARARGQQEFIGSVTEAAILGIGGED